ncbi:MAG TPA: right-handed parallel beta-helix repeat-containing protein, partial [Calditrichia bacterium]|nr:right-handed parallel beta-helix repeat-containing protein [Calditrichia bacterium]
MKKRFFMMMALCLMFSPLLADNIYVDDQGSNGNGTQGNPFNNISDAISAANPGDVIYILPGDYDLSNSLNTVRSGNSGNPITIRGYDANDRPHIRQTGRVISIDHAYIVLQDLLIDGEFGDSDVVRVRSGGDNLIIRDCEIRNGTNDGIDLAGADDVLIEGCEIHHMLNGTYSNQQDAHGIVATNQVNLTIRGCNIYYVSGDCFQSDPSRSAPLWDNILIEDCRMWTGPLPADAAGFNAGEVPGENAIDTKIDDGAIANGYRPRITIRNVEAFGFVPGYISNRAAFNIKENIEATLDRILVYDCEIAFRLRGPGSRGGAHVTLTNAIAYNNDKNFRLEDGIEELKIYNSTFDLASGAQHVQVAGGYDASTLDWRNCLFLGEVPSQATHNTNMLASAGYFVNRNARNYRLVSGAAPINGGDMIAAVQTDFDGYQRNAGAYDIGAFEFNATTGVDDLPYAAMDFELGANYPNPFNPSTTIPFSLERPGEVRLLVYNILGQVVRILAEGQMSAGAHQVRWDG